MVARAPSLTRMQPRLRRTRRPGSSRTSRGRVLRNQPVHDLSTRDVQASMRVGPRPFFLSAGSPCAARPRPGPARARGRQRARPRWPSARTGRPRPWRSACAACRVVAELLAGQLDVGEHAAQRGTRVFGVGQALRVPVSSRTRVLRSTPQRYARRTWPEAPGGDARRGGAG